MKRVLEVKCMNYKLTPYPLSIEEKEGKFNKDVVYISDGSSKLHDTIAKMFAGKENVANVVLSYDEMIVEEGYILSIQQDNIEIKAKNDAGHYYGALTLQQLRKQFGRKLPCLIIKDAPKSNHRGAMVNYGQANVKYTRDWLMHFIRKCGEWRINYLYLYFEWNYSFESVSGLKNPFYPNREDMRFIIQYAENFNVTIIPQLNFLGHSYYLRTKEKFVPFLEGNTENLLSFSASDLCATDEKVFQFVAKLVEEICDVFPSEYIHLGGDEVAQIGTRENASKIRENLGELGIYLTWFGRLNKILKARGKKMMLWSDMILKLCDNSPFWPDETRLEKKYYQQNIKLLQELKDNLIVTDWWYFGGSKKSLDFFREQGIQTVASSSTMGCYTSCVNPDQFDNIYKFYHYAQEIGAHGVMLCDWINHLGYHSENMMLLYAESAILAWSGCKDGFVQDRTLKTFEKQYCLEEYGTEKMVDYIYFSGSKDSVLLAPLPQRKRGVALRHFVFQYANPLALYCTLYEAFSVDDNFSAYVCEVNKLQKMWEEIEPCLKNKYQRAMKLPYVLHTTIRDSYALLSSVHKSYHEASLCQYENQQMFQEKIEDCVKTLQGLFAIYERVSEFSKMSFKYFGNDYTTILRMRAMKKNIARLIKYMDSLKDSHRTLASFANIETRLFKQTSVTLYNFCDFDWILDKSEFFVEDSYNNKSVFVNDVECFFVQQDE